MQATKDTTDKVKAFKRIDTTFASSYFKHFWYRRRDGSAPPKSKHTLKYGTRRFIVSNCCDLKCFVFGEGPGRTSPDGRRHARTDTKWPPIGARSANGPMLPQKEPGTRAP